MASRQTRFLRPKWLKSRLGNTLVEWRTPKNLRIWYVPLILTLLLTWAVAPGVLNSLDVLSRAVVGGLMFALPVGFAAVVFATIMKTSSDPSAALSSNLIGAMVGGIAEYSSMALGLRAMVLLATLAYLGSLLALIKRKQTAIA